MNKLYQTSLIGRRLKSSSTLLGILSMLFHYILVKSIRVGIVRSLSIRVYVLLASSYTTI